MKKNPRNLNFDAVPDIKAEDITAETVLYDGPTRGVLPLYPKNVNSHATLALSTLGLDRTRSILVADPSLEVSVIEIDASGQGNQSYCQMLCMALGGDPFFNNAVNKVYSFDYFSKSLRMVQLDPSFLSTST